MAQDLLERQSELQALDGLVERAMAGSGSIALVAGEAGIGKSSLVRSFLESLPREVRVLAAGCEDLLTPRALGPLRDAVRGKRGPLSDALAADTGPDAVFPAVLDELGSGAPTVLVVDDAHWADGATLDVLRFLGRRVSGLPAVLLITYRDDELDARHPLRGVLGAMAGPDVLRLRLTPFSAATVTELAADSAVDAAELFRLTEGNPFFVTEVLTAPDVLVPPTVVDAVLARVGGVSPEAQAAVRQLAVVPSGAELGLVRRLVPDLTPIGEAEAAGVVTMRGEVLRFRHELARRAVAESTPVSVRAELHAAVLRVLTDDPDPDPCRVLHHAVGAGDDDAVIEYGQLAGRRAARAGAYRQAVSCFAFVLDRGARVPPEQLARVAEGQAWALANSNEFHAAAEAAATAVEQWGLAGGDTKLVRSLITLTRQLWLTERTSEALVPARRALELAEPQGDTADHVLARLGLGGCLVLVDRETEGIEHLEIALELAERIGVHDLAALTHNYLGSARLQLGDLGGRDELLVSVELCRALPNHEYVMRGYYNLGEGLWRLGRYDEAMGFMEQAEAYAADRDFPAHSYMVEARRLRRLGMQGRWTEAVTGLRSMLDGRGDPGMIGRETLPILARLLVRQGDPEAESVLAESIEHAERADVLEWLVPTGLAAIEHAWLTGRPEAAGRFPELLLERTARPGTDVQRGALLRNLKRLGHAVAPPPRCPPGYAAGITGDWQAAADAWELAGDPYERALELAGSGDVDATLEGLAVLDRLGARPAAEAARVRLRELGVSRVPRRPGPGKVENPAGLTERQVEILGLLAGGLSNAEIAARLVLSPRTVDHHVAAVLQKLDVHSRRDAVAVAGRLGLPLPD